MPSQRILDAFYQLSGAPVEADLDSWEKYVEEGLDLLVGIIPECGCDYPHGHDFEPPFEKCTCEPGCSHDEQAETQEDSDMGEDNA